MRGLCIDPRWNGGTPNDQIAGLYRAVRYVLFHEGWCWPKTSAYINSGWYVRGVIAAESGNPQPFADWGPPNFDITIGNEPDVESGSSQTMSPEEYGDLWASTDNFQAPRWIAGMASGDPGRAEAYVARAPGAAGLTVHLYTLSPDEVLQRIADYQSLGLPVRVGEWHAAGGYRFHEYTFPPDVDVHDFCYSNAMVNGFGLYA